MSCLCVQFGRVYVVCRYAEDVILLIRPTSAARPCRRPLDVLTGREEDVRATSFDDVIRTSSSRLTGRRHTTSVYNN